MDWYVCESMLPEYFPDIFDLKAHGQTSGDHCQYLQVTSEQGVELSAWPF